MSNNFPPNNFIPTESKIEGIQVFKPAPPEEEKKANIKFKCPQCGANTAYSVEESGLVCSYCGYYEKPESKILGKSAEEFEFKVETLERLAQGWGEQRKEIACQSCGASVSIPEKSISITCPFCGSNKVILKEASQTTIRPRYILPFKIDTQKTTKIVREWLGSSWMTPSELRRSAIIRDITPIYLPYWTFDSLCNADWKAEVGHVVTERYYDGKEWKTRTKIKWKWESGHVRNIFDDFIMKGTNQLSAKHLDATSQYDIRDIQEYDPKFLAGMHAKSYDIDLESAWATARDRMRENTKSKCMSQASTNQIRNFSMKLDFSDESWRYVLLPVFLLAYRHNNLPFQVILNGQNGVISGQRPVDWTKVWIVIILCLLPGSFLGLIGLLTLIFGGVGAVIGGLGFFLLVIGLVISFIIFQKAQEMDDY